MKLLSLCVSVLLLPGFFLSAKDAINLHALVVSDPHSSTFFPMYEQDAITMQHHLLKVASRIGARLHMKKLAGKKATKRNVSNWVKSLPKNRKNIVFLYYVGKGTWEQGSQRPSMCLDGNVPQEAITQKIRTGKHRLVLSFFDCYDKVYTYQHTTKFIRERNKLKDKFQNINTLFLEGRGYIMGSSSSSPDTSYGIVYKNKPIGGFFSSFLFDSLKNGCRSWRWQLSMMHHHGSLVKNFTQNFFLFNGVDKPNSKKPMCK